MDESTGLRYISYGLYRLVDDTIGPEQVIQMRRKLTNLIDEYHSLRNVVTGNTIHSYVSGSVAEGLRLTGSDCDVMHVVGDVIVTDDQYHKNGQFNNTTILRLETERCRPGFALLRLASPSHDSIHVRSLDFLPWGYYLSSKRWKETVPHDGLPNETIHGPCISFTVGLIDIDLAFCIKCISWPESALGFINRLRRVGWPSHTVLRDIMNDGCHLVAIGSKESVNEDNEWRISFSFAEKTLIHNMNHCQFLCYGLFKIFLKEAVENSGNGEKLLCSYFLKTAVFWEMCIEETQWTPETFLFCFWDCFRRLITWVYHGYCPNFFIPENNMFYPKIQGQAQADLLRNLVTLYSEGYHCLLRCQSLQPVLGMIMNQPAIATILISKLELYPKSYIDRRLISAISDIQWGGFAMDMRHLRILQNLSLRTDQNNKARRLALYVWTRHATQYLTVYSGLYLNHRNNLTTKEKYHNTHDILRKLKRQAFDCVSHFLLSAVYAYRSGLYTAALRVLLHAKNMHKQEKLMYDWNLSTDKYAAAGGEYIPIKAMMRRIIAFNFVLPLSICIPELTIEHEDYVGAGTLNLPPLVMINFLLYLSHFHLGESNQAKEILNELVVLVSHGEGHHIFIRDTAIAWTMLGICQEMSGQLTNACQSYHQALNDPYNYCKNATRIRIQNVMLKC